MEKIAAPGKCGRHTKKLAQYEFLTDESTNKNRLLTIVNWGVYQGLEGSSTVHVTDE